MDGNSTEDANCTLKMDLVPFPFDMPKGCQMDQVWWFNFLTDEQIQPFLSSTSQTIMLTAMFPIIFAVGLVGNATFLLIVCLNRRMRTITNFYLSNLAVADMMFIVVSAVVGFGNYGISHGLNLGGTFYRSRFGCLMSITLVYFTYLASMILVILVSFERFLAICYPVKYRTLKSTDNTRLSAKLAAATWLVSLCFSLIIAPYQGKLKKKCIVWPARVRFQDYPEKIYICEPLYPVFKDLLAFAEAVPFIVCVAVICVLYAKIILVLRNHTAAAMTDQHIQGGRKQRHDPGGRNRKVNIDPGGRKLMQTQVTRMVVANGLVYVICLAPFQVIFILDFVWREYGENLFENEWARDLFLFARCLNALNSAINPIIYAVANPKYRKAFLRALKCSKDNSIEPSDNTQTATTEMNRTRNHINDVNEPTA